MDFKKINFRVEKEWKNISFNCIFGILTLVTVILLKEEIIISTFLLVILAIIGLIKWKSYLTLIIFFFGAIFGVISEMICIYFKVWSYTITNFYNIPLWLFIVGGNAAAFLFETAKEIKKLGFKEK